MKERWQFQLLSSKAGLAARGESLVTSSVLTEGSRGSWGQLNLTWELNTTVFEGCQGKNNSWANTDFPSESFSHFLLRPFPVLRTKPSGMGLEKPGLRRTLQPFCFHPNVQTTCGLTTPPPLCIWMCGEGGLWECKGRKLKCWSNILFVVMRLFSEDRFCLFVFDF